MIARGRVYDFHPDEADVRLFVLPGSGVLRADAEAFVCEEGYGYFAMRHYAFADRWFRVNVTVDLHGEPLDTAGVAYTCDVATPMVRQGDAVYAVSLLTSVHVRADGTSFTVTGADTWEQAVEAGWISQAEARGARRGLADLLTLIEDGRLEPFLADICAFGPPAAPGAQRMRRVPLADLPLLQPGKRASWRYGLA